MSWNPDQYLKFSAPRLRPAIDLLAAVPTAAARVVYDLGCGAGNVTRQLAERWPDAEITGVDDSPEMLAKAAAELPGVRFVERSLNEWRADRPADVIYSNAALHWLPAHRELFPVLLGQLERGGVLAVQMPRNFDAPSHAAIAETVTAGPWRARLEHLLQPAPVAPPDFYYGLLAPIAERVDIWETEYLQVLDGQDPVKEWTKGTWLKQFLDALEDDTERAAFERDYAARVAAAYPVRKDGKTLFPFRRLFIVATAA